MSFEILTLVESHQRWPRIISSLSRCGHNALLVDRYCDAIFLLNQSIKCDLIISDVHLQNGGDVFDLLRWVRTSSDRADLPFIMLNCEPTLNARYLDETIRTTARLLGVSLYVTQEKFDSDELVGKIDMLLSLMV